MTHTKRTRFARHSKSSSHKSSALPWRSPWRIAASSQTLLLPNWTPNSRQYAPNWFRSVFWQLQRSRALIIGLWPGTCFWGWRLNTWRRSKERRPPWFCSRLSALFPSNLRDSSSNCIQKPLLKSTPGLTLSLKRMTHKMYCRVSRPCIQTRSLTTTSRTLLTAAILSYRTVSKTFFRSKILSRCETTWKPGSSTTTNKTSRNKTSFSRESTATTYLGKSMINTAQNSRIWWRLNPLTICSPIVSQTSCKFTTKYSCNIIWSQQKTSPTGLKPLPTSFKPRSLTRSTPFS